MHFYEVYAHSACWVRGKDVDGIEGPVPAICGGNHPHEEIALDGCVGLIHECICTGSGCVGTGAVLPCGKTGVAGGARGADWADVAELLGEGTDDAEFVVVLKVGTDAGEIEEDGDIETL